MRSGEIEIVTRYEADADSAYEAFAEIVAERHADTLYSTDGTTVDEQVASLLRGEGDRPKRTMAVAESCTGGLLAARPTNPPGASEYVLGGVGGLLQRGEDRPGGRARRDDRAYGAVSEEVAKALALGASAPGWAPMWASV